MNSSSTGQSGNITKKISNYSRQGLNSYRNSSTMGKVIFIVVLILILSLLNLI